ncbi:hypothetical protein EYM_01375 [Ignicoccus islandicus DSM 13165]|uniref:Uncharacterized protein n=1 Tax=Ignicoccus islandicus DSM 13165 TaxID=940295 RepID=A0A0U2M946_9CREN|nr:hypothetical protein [Ignicoccus islandicus]ALU11469.1 hypothetical protein EYM_01375 [Ignicoccus islandicus DSM 13165]
MKPIHAQGYYFVTPLGSSWQIIEVVNYYYYDEEGLLASKLHKPREYREEILTTWENMQRALDSEEVKVNGKPTKVTVRNVSMEFVGFKEVPYFTFVLEFHGPIVEGINCFENSFEEGVAEYDYEAFWLLPPGYEFVEAVTSCEYDLPDEEGRILMLWCRKGDKVKGYERICWRSSNK